MARRANPKIRPLWVALILGALMVAIVIGLVLQTGGGDPFRTVPELELADYLANANSLRGNTYKVKGTVFQSLGYSRSKGRLFSVEVGGGSGAAGGGSEILPILIPPALSYINLQRGQRYIFRLEVDDGGILRALDLKKS
jgi:hypothetical protein